MALNLIKLVHVSPATDSFGDSVDCRSLPLTFFDLRWIKFHPNQRVIFFKVPESTRESFNSKILPNFKLSLSILLRHYLPLIGSLKWGPQDPKPSLIVSQNDTVSLTVAEINADFSHVSGNGVRLATELHPLVPELTVSDDSASVISLQITLFPNHGFCIGITSHHAVLDGTTTAMFLKSWAHICRSHHADTVLDFPLLPEDLTPRFDRTVINVPAQLETKMMEFLFNLSSDTDKDNFRNLKPPPINETSVDVVRVTLELTRENIEKLRERVRNESSRSPLELQHLSRFVIAYAYVFTCVVKARGGDANRPVNIRYAADLRHRLKPSVPVSYFGNCVFPIGCFEYEAKTLLEEDGFVNAVEILSDSVKGLGSVETETLFDLYVEGVKRVKSGTQIGSVAGSPRLGIYELDFGWGKPNKTEIVSIDRNEAFSISEMKNQTKRGGVEIGLCRKNHLEMNMFLSLFQNGLL